MSIAPASARRRFSGFTLLEITLAVAILGMMSLAIYRFVQSNITVLRISSQQSAADAQYDGLINLLTSEWQALPSGVGALTGEPYKFNDRPRDEITWIGNAGPGVLTRYASGDYVVSLRLKPGKNRDELDLGLVRRLRGSLTEDEGAETWVPLLDNVRSLQIRYFDPRLNSWVERWTDTSTLPRLIRLVFERPDREKPWEAIIALGRTPL